MSAGDMMDKIAALLTEADERAEKAEAEARRYKAALEMIGGAAELPRGASLTSLRMIVKHLRKIAREALRSEPGTEGEAPR